MVKYDYLFWLPGVRWLEHLLNTFRDISKQKAMFAEFGMVEN
jgi:hypothetical protein